MAYVFRSPPVWTYRGRQTAAERRVFTVGELLYWSSSRDSERGRVVFGAFLSCGLFHRKFLLFVTEGRGMHMSLLMVLSVTLVPFALVCCAVSGAAQPGGICYRLMYPGDDTPVVEVDPFPSRYANLKFKPSRGRLGAGFYGGRGNVGSSTETP